VVTEQPPGFRPFGRNLCLLVFPPFGQVFPAKVNPESTTPLPTRDLMALVSSRLISTFTLPSDRPGIPNQTDGHERGASRHIVNKPFVRFLADREPAGPKAFPAARAQV